MSIFKNMAYQLKNLLVKELSLVDRGANQKADVVLFKQDHESGGMIPMLHTSIKDLLKGEIQTMKPEDLMKAFEEMTSKLEKAFDEKLAPVIEKVETLEKASCGDGEKPKKEKMDDEEMNKSEEISKALEAQKAEFTKQFEVLQKQFEDAQAIVKAEQEKRETLELTARVEKEFPYVKGTTEEKVALLKSIGDNQSALEILKASNEMAKSLLTEKGHSIPVASSAEDAIDKIAKAFIEKDATLTYAEAYDKALSSEEGQKLYQKSLKGE